MLASRKFFIGMLAVVGLLTTATYARADAITFTSVKGGARDGNERVIGWEFTVGAQDLRLTNLGVYDHNADGLLGEHAVGIYDYATENLIVSAVVPGGTSGSLRGLFRYVGVTPIELLANHEYVIAASWPGNLDEYVWPPANSEPPGQILDFSVDPHLTLGISSSGLPPRGRFRCCDTSVLQFPADRMPLGNPRTAFVGPNFTFSPVPEPSTLLFLGSGLAGLAAFAWRRRSS